MRIAIFSDIHGNREALISIINDIKKILIVVVFQTLYAWLIATIFYQVASHIKYINFANVIIIGLLLFIISLIIVRTRKRSYCDNCNK